MSKTPIIFLTDDNPDDQSFIRDAFSYVNANVVLKVFDSGHDLLEQLKIIKEEDQPSLIVLDYNMPGMNGVEVLEVLIKQNRYKHIPKIILSTSFYQQHIDYCMQIGADGYLIKPDNLFSWKKIVLRMLAYIQEPEVQEMHDTSRER